MAATTDPANETDRPTAGAAAPPWTARLLEQLTFHWDNHLRPRLEGLTDDEYLWEPVPGCWSLRPRSEAGTAMAAGAGDLVADFELPEPDPTPFTTIAWRLAHISVGVLGMRNASHFGAPPIDYQSADWPATADGALAGLDDGYRRWVEGVAALDAEALERPVGPAEGPWAEHSHAELVLHIHREVIHHGAEVLLLRDLYRRRCTTTTERAS
jgi:DinB superfamily